MKGIQICIFYPEVGADVVPQVDELILCCLYLAGFSCQLWYVQEETLPSSPLFYPSLSSSTFLQRIKLHVRNSFDLWQVLSHKKPFFFYQRGFPTSQVMLGLWRHRELSLKASRRSAAWLCMSHLPLPAKLHIFCLWQRNPNSAHTDLGQLKVFPNLRPSKSSFSTPTRWFTHYTKVSERFLAELLKPISLFEVYI